MISSCCREASSVLRASSSAMAEIWRLDNPDRTQSSVQSERGRDRHQVYYETGRHRGDGNEDLLSSFTQSLTSCCSFSSYVSVSDFRWLACMNTSRIKRYVPSISAPNIVCACVLWCEQEPQSGATGSLLPDL